MDKIVEIENVILFKKSNSTKMCKGRTGERIAQKNNLFFLILTFAGRKLFISALYRHE